MNVYKSIFQSKLNYIWASTCTNRITKLRKLQNKAISICLNLRQTDHIDYNSFNILGMKKQTKCKLIIYMYKHKHNLLNPALIKIFKLNTNNNRNLRSANNYKEEK